MTRKKLRTIEKRKLSKECQDLDMSFLDWLHARLPIYLRDAQKVVDLNFNKYTYKDKEYTQKEIIERMIFLLDDIYKHLGSYEMLVDLEKTELIDLWNLVFWAMWW